MRPRLLDLFCCQGGAAKGYADAGFEVVGVDIVPQPRYPFEFDQSDALAFLHGMIETRSVVGDPELLGRHFDAIHASPPCQAYSKAQRIRGNDHDRLIAATREALQATGLPYVIENVEEARDELVDPVMLCGTMFGLRLYRHRYFECSFPVTPPLHGQHWLRQVKMGRKPTANEVPQPVGNFSGVQLAREVMEMPWASREGLREAIPPAYTDYLGRSLMAALERRAVA